MTIKAIAAIATSIALSVSGTPSASASAGWYPTYPGDYIDLSVCLPIKHGPIIYLQGSDGTKNFKTLVKFKPVLSKDVNFCGSKSKEREYIYQWQVNIKGSYGLTFVDPTYHKRYYGWPDGIESK